MVIYEYPPSKKQNIPDCVLALGFFDGVHSAHRDLISKARRLADEQGLALGIFTFKSSGKIKNKAPRLFDDSDKAEIFSSLGADFTVFADFDNISDLSPKDFVNQTLINHLSCKICVAGYNFRFGKGASAGEKELRQLMQNAGGNALILDEVKAEDGTSLSASIIRELIASGEIESANKYLGSPYYLKGRVSQGRQDGRRIGFPTANLALRDGQIIPREGVYRSAVALDGKIYSAVTNIGVCPTLSEDSLHLEAHIIDYSGDIYGRDIRVYLLGYLREEKAFSSVEELKMQINIDKNTTIRENGDITWQELGLK